MVICVKCKNEMVVKQNGKGIRYGNSHVYAGDLYKCTNCESEVIVTNSQSTYDPEHNIDTIQMGET